MILDILAWVSRSPAGAAASKISSYQEAVDGTKINNDYFMKNRNGNCKFLNVLQGENHADAEDWYQQMKDYCDPKKYTDHFNGWSMGGQNMCDVHLVLKRLVALRFDGLLVPKKCITSCKPFSSNPSNLSATNLFNTRWTSHMFCPPIDQPLK
jgi:hypothetical protein